MNPILDMLFYHPNVSWFEENTVSDMFNLGLPNIKGELLNGTKFGIYTEPPTNRQLEHLETMKKGKAKVGIAYNEEQAMEIVE